MSRCVRLILDSGMSTDIPLLLRQPPRSRTLGIAVALAAVALTTLAVYPLKQIAPRSRSESSTCSL